MYQEVPWKACRKVLGRWVCGYRDRIWPDRRGHQPCDYRRGQRSWFQSQHTILVH